MGLSKTTPPAIEPITLTEAKAHLRIVDSLDDVYITTLISVAREWCERYTNRQFITATYTYTLPYFRGCKIVLPRPNLLGVTSIKYYDTENILQTLSASDYTVITNSLPGMVELNYTSSWPSTYIRAEAVSVIYTSGYGVTAASVPTAIKQAILIMIASLYENRESIPKLAIESLLQAEKVPEFY